MVTRSAADPSANTARPGIRHRAGEALLSTTMVDLVAAARALRIAWDAGERDVATPQPLLEPHEVVHPRLPALVEPRSLRARRLGTEAGRIAAIHAIAHIEANAIRLALDAVHRFDGLPEAYYGDWLKVADEEAAHFTMLAARLEALGAAYGDLPAHDGLWRAAARTADDPLRRMALVPRVLEARGLDVTPGMLERFRSVGDAATAEVLEVILRDEVGHVAIGSRWFDHLCVERDVEPSATFLRLLDEAGVDVPPPLNEGARAAAGFSALELEQLKARHQVR